MRTTRRFWRERRFRNLNHVLNMRDAPALKGHCCRPTLHKTVKPFSPFRISLHEAGECGPPRPSALSRLLVVFPCRPASGTPGRRVSLRTPCRSKRVCGAGVHSRGSAGFCPASRREAPCRESWTRGRISIDDTAAQRGALSCFAFVLFRFTGTLRCLTLSVKTFSLPAGIADACSIWGAAEA